MTTRVSHEFNTLREAVQSNFAKVRAALYMREKLLLRQLDVIAQQSYGRGYEAPLGIKFLINEQEETALYENIRSFGRFQLGNMNLALQHVYLRHEDYIRPHKDHEVMNKCLTPKAEEEEQEKSVEQELDLLSLTQNKLLMEDTCRQISESIINLTLTEAKKLLNQTQHKIVANFVPTLDLDNEEDISTTQVDAISSLLQDQTQSSTTHCKHKIVINNCNGTINLRDIASLVINCTGEEAVNAELPLQAADNSCSTGEASQAMSGSSTNHCHCKISKNNSNRKNKPKTHSINSGSLCSHKNKNNHSKILQQTHIIDETSTSATCEFYNNLLQQIKHSLVSKPKQQANEIVVLNDVENDNDYSYYMKQKSRKVDEEEEEMEEQEEEEEEDYLNENEVQLTTMSSDVNDNETSTQSQQNVEETDNSVLTTSTTNNNNNNRRLVLRNFENLKIILEANSDEETSHPVQIEQWLAEIISESDLEPIANTDFLEHSKIDSS